MLIFMSRKEKQLLRGENQRKRGKQKRHDDDENDQNVLECDIII
jgi:hypothetical protein